MKKTKTTSLLIASVAVLQVFAIASPAADARGARGGHRFPGSGYSEAHCGFHNHYDNYGRWGTGRMYAPGAWGGWARPRNRWWNTGWGGWSEPCYGGPGTGFVPGSAPVDQEGNVYPSANYNIGGLSLGQYAGHSASETVSAEIKKKPDIEPVRMNAVSTKSVYKLGPDTDVLDNGNVAVRLNDASFLIVDSEKTSVVDQKTGVPVILLYTDPLLLWNLSYELKRQASGLKASMMSKQATLKTSGSKQNTAGDLTSSSQKASASGSLAPSSKSPESENLEWIIAQLEKAQTKLGEVPEQPPGKDAYPVPDCVELFASVWLLKDGTFILFKQPDGSLIYMNDRGTYTDRGKTARSLPYPDTFELAVYGYLKTLLKEYKPTVSKLTEDKEDTEWALSKLREVSDPEADQLESQRRLAEAVARSERRLDVIQKQIQIMPDEVEAARKALAILDKG
jgi:hypothetical protein